MIRACRPAIAKRHVLTVTSRRYHVPSSPNNALRSNVACPSVHRNVFVDAESTRLARWCAIWVPKEVCYRVIAVVALRTERTQEGQGEWQKDDRSCQTHAPTNGFWKLSVVVGHPYKAQCYNEPADCQAPFTPHALQCGTQAAALSLRVDTWCLHAPPT
jgi:hypothetical protein